MNASSSGRVIHIASSHKMGLTAQETELAIAYKKLNSFELLVVTGENEQFEGSFDRLLKNGVKNNIIKGFDEHGDFFRLVRDFVDQCNVYCPQIVTLNTNWQLLIVGLARIFCSEKFKIIYTVHGFRHNEKIKSHIALLLIKILLKVFADVVNAPTTYVARKFSPLKGKMVSIPLGEDPIFFEQSKPNQFGSTLNMIFAGQFRAGKNQDILIRAVHDYIAQTGDNDVVLYLPGSGDLLPAAQQLANELNVAESIVFPGQLNRLEVLDLYNQCQIAVVPTNSETFGHCIAEPLVLQKIVISRPVGVAVDVIEHGSNGFLFETSDELIQILIKIRNMRPEELANISAHAKETGEMFRWENIAKRHYQEVFRNLF